MTASLRWCYFFSDLDVAGHIFYEHVPIAKACAYQTLIYIIYDVSCIPAKLLHSEYKLTLEIEKICSCFCNFYSSKYGTLKKRTSCTSVVI